MNPDLNDAGDVLYRVDTYEFDYFDVPIDKLWSGGESHELPYDDGYGFPLVWTEVANDGMVMGYVFYDASVIDVAVWTVEGGLELLPVDEHAPYDTEYDYYANNAPFIAFTRAGDIYFEGKYFDADNIYSVFLHWDATGNVSEIGDPLLRSGADTPPFAYSVTLPLGTTSGNDTLEFTLALGGADYDVEEVLIDPEDPEGGTYPVYTLALAGGYTAVQGAYLLNEVVLAGGVPNLPFGEPGAAIGFGHPYDFADRVGILTHPYVLAAANTPNTLSQLVGGGFTARHLPADPRAGTIAHFKFLNTLGFGLTGNDDFPLWFGGRSHSKEELGFVSGNETANLGYISSNTCTVAGTSTSGNVILGGSVYINPDSGHNMNLTNFFSANISGNAEWIVNPAVIVQNQTAYIAVNVSDGFLASVGGNAHLCLVVNTESGDPGNTSLPLLGNHTANGTVTFPNGNHTWTVLDSGADGVKTLRIPVQGGSEGRVRFTLKELPGNSSTPQDFAQVTNGTAVPVPNLKYEAYVGPMLTLKYRVQRLFYYDDTTLFGFGNDWTTPSPSTTLLQDSISVANTYLKQAGIQLVLDSNTTVMNQIGNVSNISYSVNSTTSIFDVRVSNATISNPNITTSPHGEVAVTDFYYRLHNTTAFPALTPSNTGNINPTGSIRYQYAEELLSNNHDPGVLQIAILGMYREKPSAEAPASGVFGNAYWSVDTVVGGNQSNCDYIVSLADTDALDESHYLNHLIENDYSLVSGANLDGLFGLGLFFNNPYLALNKNFLGKIIAHETSHVLSLQHYLGEDGLNAQTTPGGRQLASAAQNLMWGTTATPQLEGDRVMEMTENINLHQALILRNHAILSP